MIGQVLWSLTDSSGSWLFFFFLFVNWKQGGMYDTIHQRKCIVCSTWLIWEGLDGMFSQKLLRFDWSIQKSLRRREAQCFENLSGALHPRFIVRGRKYVNTSVFSDDINTNCPENDKTQHIIQKDWSSNNKTLKQKRILIGTNEC